MTAENLPFRKHALLYQRVENILKNSSEPMTSNDLLSLSAIHELDLSGNSLYDALDSLHRKKLVRKLPHQPTAKDKCRTAYEWIKNAVPKVEETGAAGFLKETAEHVKPEIIVGANSVVIITEKIKITVEY